MIEKSFGSFLFSPDQIGNLESWWLIRKARFGIKVERLLLELSKRQIPLGPKFWPTPIDIMSGDSLFRLLPLEHSFNPGSLCSPRLDSPPPRVRARGGRPYPHAKPAISRPAKSPRNISRTKNRARETLITRRIPAHLPRTQLSNSPTHRNSFPWLPKTRLPNSPTLQLPNSPTSQTS
jgi:hypothetical protein